jgi:YD repeat-containing protein
MTDYPFDNILAVDSSGPELLGGLPVIRVASNALVTLFDLADPAKTPVALKTVDGLPIPNPVQVNAIGMGPAPVAQFWQIGWEGGGLSGVFTSNLGLRNETLAAVDAAQGARLAAENAASTAGADAVAAVSVALADVVSDVDAAKGAAESAAALVGAPADTAMAAAANNSGSQFRGALNATFVPGNPTLVVTYNGDGSVATTTENGVLTSFTYNTDGTVATQTRAGVTKTFTYDANGNVTGAA